MEATTAPVTDLRSTGEHTQRVPPLLWAVAAAAFVVHAAFAWRYGFHRDEFYYLVGGHHLDWGYVDHPPLTPLLARITEIVAGPSFVALRFVAAAACAGIVVMVGLTARELGGRPRSVVLAGFAAASTPLLIGTGALFSTATFDQLAWSVCTWCAVRLVVSRNPAWWPLVGASFGVALLTKYTVAGLGLGIVVGLAATPARRLLRSPWLLAGAATAAVLVLPNALWQMNHDMAVVEFTANMSSRDSNRLRFLAEQILFIGPVGIALAVPGLRKLWRDTWLRCLVWAVVVVYVILLAGGAKGYYAGGLYPLLLAVGAAAVTSERPWWWSFGIQLGIASLLALPVLPLTTVHALHLEAFREEWAEMAGWEELVDTVADVRDSLAPHEQESVQILAASYGEAGAIEILGPRRGLPAPVSGHNSYTFWGPPTETADVVITVRYRPETVAPFFGSCETAATVANRYGIANQIEGTPVLVCRDPLETWSDVWPRLRRYS